ncbi:hypothetical protein AVP42_02601 [Agromyces sp. NDB4Y10]|jgi:protein-disulfide isomerase|uniref:DsbA family protein n=1 Tax=Agromyces sp. NDB4Y10 TaxID=1775951 RepID=UPI0007B19766|nr:thioredoxin domain-containing protein [Agromyces sp. NDB4Y10]KZE92447.1 hypothetical protein AVP42_02601 [Agromyces sp. NDB4Y10]
MSTSTETPATQPTAKPRRTRRTLWLNLVAIAAVILISVIAIMAMSSTNSAEAPVSENPEVVREDSHVLGEPGSGNAVLVEFLDFECEACGAAYPFIESLRERYAGQVTFVARYFPIPSHKNALNAALAAEAAAQQGRFEEMYGKLFDTQAEWGEQQQSNAPLFRSFAEEIGLDLEQFDRDVADPATRERVLADQADGTALGVQGTPTFFLNGEKLELQSADDLVQAIDAALAE